jgi:hypothetical protein
MSSSKTKARYWQAVGYNENFIDNWQDVIAEKFQVPFCYCIHDKDETKTGEHRKTHTHIILAFGNTTTENFALQVFKTIQKDGCQAYPNDVIQQVFDIGNAYAYLIHDTDDSRKKGKFQYDKKERITGNNFDIGNYEQLGKDDKIRMFKELGNLIVQNNYTNFTDFYMDVQSNYDDTYFDILTSHSGFFERIIKGNYLKMKMRGDV